jgi:PhoPQ-activated pathogenicity-related protein
MRKTNNKMNRATMHIYRLGLIAILFLVGCKQQSGQGEEEIQKPKLSPLEAYISAPDDAFEYKSIDRIKGEGFTYYVIRMVSQRWLTTAEVEDPVWWHWLTIIVPDGAKSNKAMLFISGGSHNTKQPKKPKDMLLQIAMGTQSVVVGLHNIPNQPTVFKNDDYGPRSEDEIIAFGWRQFLEGGAKIEDAEWLARFPMTKAAVRAMDVVEEFTADSTSVKIDEFVVAGGSKRGWTTWTTAIVDERVVAIAPIVIDMLNLIPSFNHHWRAYGRWADAVGDYESEGIMEWQNSREYEQLVALTEPFSFREKLTMPKLILNATGDQFFLPDSWQFYWNDLVGEKHMRYVPNSEHSMRDTDAIESLAAFYQMILTETERPDFDWEVVNGTISIQTQEKHPPKEITLWQAHNPDSRNFQVAEIGRAYEATKIPISPDGKYQIQVDQPTKGWTAFFVELTFPGVTDIPLKLTTGVTVTPDKYPFENFKSKNPQGTMK